MKLIIPTDIVFTTAVMNDCVNKLALQYPCLNVNTIGTSLKGCPIYSLSLGYGPVSYMYNAAHHANEWITAVVLMKFTEDCAQQVLPVWNNLAGGKEPGEPTVYKPWYERITLHMVPMVNPDGVDIVVSGNSFAAWKANASGVDLNSNYPACWELAKEHKYSRGYTQPGPRDFVGPFPLSEPESMAMVAYTKLTDCALTISLHTQGEVIYWRYRDYLPPGAADMAARLSIASGYELDDVPDDSSHGGYRDWFIQEYNRPGFTIECGSGENPLPISDLDGIYERVYPLLMEPLR